jgi:hypothetical protein
VAAAERERSARAEGDVVHGPLAPMAGSLVAGTLAVGLAVPSALEAWLPFARGVTDASDPANALRAAIAILGHVAWVAAASAGGALLVGGLQTRGYFGRPSTDEWRRDASPSRLLVVSGWVVTIAVTAAAARAAMALHPASPSALGGAVVILLRGYALAAVSALSGVAAIDHVLRTRARRERLGLEEVDRRRPVATPPWAEPSRWDDTLVGARAVLFDARQAIVLEERRGAIYLRRRVTGLDVEPVCKAARARGLSVRQVAGLEQVERQSTDEPLTEAQLVAWGISAVLSGDA